MDPCSRPTKSCHGASNRAAILGFLQIQFEVNIQHMFLLYQMFLLSKLQATEKKTKKTQWCKTLQ